MPFRVAFKRGWWAGLVFNAGLLYWIALNSGAEGVIAPLSFVGMLLVFPLYWALFTALWSFLYRRWGNLAVLVLPAVWVALEIIKAAPEIGFPWQELGLSQVGFLPAVQIAEFGGIHLVSVWVVGVNSALFLWMEKKRLIPSVIFVLAGLCIIWGYWRMHHLPLAGPNLKVLIVQGNVDPRAKWQDDPDTSICLYEELTRSAIKREGIPDLVLWPETAIPSYLSHQQRDQRRLRNLAGEIGAPILTGAPHYELKPTGGSLRFNSAFFFPADGSPPQRYDKIRLVPFGERVPFQRIIPQLGELNFGQAEFTAGSRYTVFSLKNNVTVAAQICFESVFGPEARRFAANGARLFCNLTNDGWYGNSSGPYQHAALVQFRSIESRYSLARAANTGISLAVERTGRITQRIPWGQRAALTVNVTAGGEEPTFYLRHGEAIPNMIGIIGGIFLLITLLRRDRNIRR